MSTQSTVTFKVAGNDVISYMDKMKQKADQMTTEMISNARKQSEAAKEQLRSLEDQIKALERKSKIENEAARQNVTKNRDFLKEQNKAEYDETVRKTRADTSLTNPQKEGRVGLASDIRNAKDDMANKDSRDQLVAIREQERQSMLQTKLLRDNVETVKMTSGQEIIQMRKGDDSLIEELDKDASPMQELSRKIAEQKYQEEQDKNKKPPEEKPESTMGGFLKAMALERGLSLGAQIPGAKNELDFVKPMMSMIGMGLGGLIGNIMDMADVKVLGTGLGQSNWGAMGTQIGEKAGEFFGQAMERSYKGRDELTGSNFRLQALTGRNMEVNGFGASSGLGGTGISKFVNNLEEYGLDLKEASELQYKVATARGTSEGMGRNAENSIAAERALGVSQETSQALMEMRRQYSGDFMKLVGGIAQRGQGNIFQGGDRTFLNEFIGKNFISLQKELLKQGADNVSSGATFDVLRRFNDVGGAFSARDPRSMGLISQINNSLVNPGSDSMKAYSFMALRQANPGMGIADIMTEREKGVSSPTYLKSMLGMIDKMGGDDQFKRMNLAQAFGISNTAAKRLYENKDALMNGTISQDEVMGTGQYGEANIRTEGQGLTSRYTKSTAQIQDAFIKDVVGGITTVGSKMKELFGDMIGQVKQYVKDQFTEATTGGPTPVGKNKVLTDKQKKDMHKRGQYASMADAMQ